MIARLEKINEWSVHPHKKKTVWHLLILDTEYLQIVCDPCRGQGRPGGGTEEGSTLQYTHIYDSYKYAREICIKMFWTPSQTTYPPPSRKLG